MKISNLSKIYKNNLVLNNISYEFEKNNCYLITGVNGCGKSTLIKIILGFVNKNDGLIENNLDYSYIPEKLNIPDNVKVIDYLELMKETRNCSNDKMMYLIDYFELNNHLDKKIKSLSKGTYQKLLIIQALMNEASLIILDEVLNGLDYYMQQKLLDLIKRLIKGRIIIVVTHYEKYFLDVATKIIRIENGKII